MRVTREEFDILKEAWREGTKHYSSIRSIMKNSACRDLAAYGEEIIPWIIEEIEGGDCCIGWSMLLQEITGVNPYDCGSDSIKFEDGFAKVDVRGLAEWWVKRLKCQHYG